MHFDLDSSVYGLRTLLLLGAFVGFGWAMLSSRRQSAEAHAQMAARLETALAEIRKLSGQLIVLGGNVDSMGMRLVHAQAQAEAQAQAQAQAQAHAAASKAAATSSAGNQNTRGYETAIRLARSGASVEEIVANCGTTRAEAKLLRRLHECGEPRRAEQKSVNFG